MQFYPILIPHDSGGVAYHYPGWVKFITGSGLFLAAAGIIALLVFTAIWMTTGSDRFDPTEKPASYSFAITFIGLAVFIAGLICAAITGTPIQ